MHYKRHKDTFNKNSGAFIKGMNYKAARRQRTVSDCQWRQCSNIKMKMKNVEI